MFFLLAQVTGQMVPGSTAYDFGAGIGYGISGVCFILLMGHLSGKIAEACGLDYWLFALLGLFLNVIGVLITVVIYFAMAHRHNKEQKNAMERAEYYDGKVYGEYDSLAESLMRDNPPAPPPKEAFAAGSRICPRCKMNVPLNDYVCWKCSFVFEPGNIMEYCPKCNNELPVGAVFCNHCGSRVNTTVPSWK